MRSGLAYLSALSIEEHQADFADVETIDRLIIDAENLTVEELKQILRLAWQRPLGEKRLIFFDNADFLSEIMQNTLLKLLEEPPTSLILVLRSENIEALLPTVRSRLHRIRSSPQTKFPEKSSLPTSLAAAEPFLFSYNREQLKALFKEELLYWRQVLLKDPALAAAKKIEILSDALTRLERNSNPKIVTDWFLLHWFNI